MDTGFTTFTLYEAGDYNGYSGSPIWYTERTSRPPFGAVWKNMGSPAYGVDTGQLSLHPGDASQPGVVRWTAPAGVSGPATIKGQFLTGDIGVILVDVRINGVEVWNAVDSGTFNLSTNIVLGDTIDFAVYGGYEYGNTPLDVKITVTSMAGGAPDPNWWQYQDDWHNVDPVGGPPDQYYIALSATNATGVDWHDPNVWGSQNNGFGVSSRPPDSNVYAAIEPKPPSPIIVGDATCSRLSIQPWSWEGAPNIEVNIAPNAGIVNCGVCIGIGDRVDYDSTTQGHGTLNVYGGTMITPTALSPPSDINGLWIGGGEAKTGNCYGVVNMYGGEIIVPRIAVYYGVVNLYGGLLEGTSDAPGDFILFETQPMNKINVAGGKMRLKGDRRAQLESLILDDWIIAYDAQGDVVVDYNSTDDTTIVTAIANFALQFDGIDDYVKVPTSNFPLNTGTIEGWILFTNDVTSSTYDNFYHMAQGLHYNDFGFVIWAGNIGMGWFDASGVFQGQTSWNAIGSFKAHEWHHIAYSWNETTANLYVDGVLKSSAPDGVNNMVLQPVARIGAGTYEAAGTYAMHDGMIDEVRIWNYARSNAQIKANMLSTFSGHESGLVGYWQFNEGSGQIVHDTSGNGNDGQLGSTPDTDSADPSWVLSELSFENRFWIIDHAPSSFVTTPVSYVDVTFSKEINSVSFTADDINMTGPEGPIVISSIEDKGQNLWRINFPQQVVDGGYHIYIGPHIQDVDGNEMDQDGDSISGEVPDDIYDANFVIGMSILNATITVDNAFDFYLSTDDTTLGTFIGTGNDWVQNYQFTVHLIPNVTNYIHVVGNDYGMVAGFAGIFDLTSNTFWFANNTQHLETSDINCWSVSRSGFGNSYEVPTLSNFSWWSNSSFLNGRAIWTNNGYDTDTTRYFSAAIYAVSPFRIIGHTPSSFVTTPVSYVDVTFSKEVNGVSFTADDIKMTGPEGPIVISSIEDKGQNLWRIHFPEQNEDGQYILHIGPHIEDLEGNEMDQDADGFPGEELDDVYVGSFIIDTQPPVISSISAAPGQIQCSITWITNEPATSQIEYGLTNSYGSVTPLQTQLVTNPIVNLTGLTPNTIYHYRIKSKDAAGNEALSNDAMFLTLPDTSAPDTQITSGPIEGATICSLPVSFGWTGTDDITPTAQLLYSYQMDEQGWSSFSSALTTSYSGLADGPHTFKVKAKDFANNEDLTPAIRHFTVDVLGNAPQISNIILLAGQQQVTITWSTDKPATSQVEYGPTGSYGSITTLDSRLVINHTVIVTGLLPDNVYHCRIRSVDACGRESISADLTFNTLPVPDLQVTSITAPPEAWTGSAFDVTWTVTNSGAAPASGTWVDRVYLSADNQPGNDKLLGEFSYGGGLAMGQTITRTQSVTIDRVGITEGNYYIIVITDAGNNVFEGSGENNNTLVSNTLTGVHLTPLPDLQVSLVDTPENAQAGQTISVSWRICNNGDGSTDVPTWYEHVYLSPDTDKSHAIKDYGQFENGSYLAPGECYTETYDLALPAGISGSHYIIVETDSTNAVAEADESNNRGHNITPIQVAYVAPGFLHVESVVAAPAPPTTVWAGGQVTVTWTVKNTGSCTITGRWDDVVALTPTPSWDGVHGYWGVINHIYFDGPLAVGSSYTHTESFAIPQDITPGTWYVVPVVDTHYFAGGNGNIGSGNIPRDQGSAPVQVAVPPPADLQVSIVDAPLTGAAGQTANVKWTVINNGANATYSGGWNDAVYLSADEIFDKNMDTLVGTYGHQGDLAPGASYNQSVNVTLPANISGSYYVFVYTDSGNNVYEGPWENNNFNHDPTPVAIQILPLPPSSDLQVTAINIPTNATTGQAVNLSWTVRNTGGGVTDATSWKDKVYLSTDGTFNAGTATLLGTYTHNGALAAGGSYIQNQLVIIPYCISGQFYIFVVTDSDNNVNESTGENNNTGRSTLTIQIITGQYPDIVPSNLIIPSAANVGGPIDINYTVTNVGSFWWPGVYDAWSWSKIYLSVDRTFDPQTDILLASCSEGFVAQGASKKLYVNPHLPIDVHGDFYVIIVLDAYNLVKECGGENNNIIISELPVHINATTWPDLQITSVVAPANAASGQVVTVNWTITNKGTAATPAQQVWYDTVYLSKDQILDTAFDTKLGAFPNVKSLASGESYIQSAQVEIPKGASGPYYIFVVTDSTNTVFENTDENNNTGYDSSAMVVTIPPPADLVVSSVDVPTSGTPGESATITWTVANQGTNAAVGQWTDSVYLSTDTVWDGNDVLVGRKDHTGGLSASASYTESLTAQLPALSPGSYHAIVRTDIRNNVRELDETNNSGVSTNIISIDVPELTLNVAHTSQLSTGTEHYYKVNVPAGEDLLVTLDCSDDSAFTELFLRYSDMPDRGHYDYMYKEPLEPDHEITAPSAQAGWYYILVRGGDIPNSPSNYTIKARLLAFEILGVTPGYGSNAGEVTVTIRGSKFSSNGVVSLIAPDHSRRIASRIWWKDNSTLFATFDLTGLVPDVYDVRIDDNGQTAMAEHIFQVTNGIPGKLTVQLATASALRPGQQGLLIVDYYNVGQTDVSAPLMFLEAEGANLKLSSRTDFGGSSVQFLAINPDGPAGILSPEAGGRITINLKPTISSGAIDTVLYMLSDTNQVVDWSAIKDQIRPEYIQQDAWDAVWTNFQASAGNTFGDYQDMLCDNANYLSILGEYIYDVSQLLTFEIRQSNNRLPQTTLALAIDVADAAPGLPLVFTRSFLQPLSGRYTLGPLGRGWTHQWNIYLTTDSNSNVLIYASGGYRFFRHQQNGSYAGTKGDYATLTFDQGIYSLEEPDGTVLAFRTDGRLDYLMDTNGNRITAVYTGYNLTTLQHSNGSHIQLEYNNQGRIIRVIDSVGRITDYGYDTAGEHLVSVTGPDGITTYIYNGETSGPKAHVLSSITYAGGTHEYFEYDERGRLRSTYRDGGEERTTYAYDTAGGVYITDANGATTIILNNDSIQPGQIHNALGQSVRFGYDSFDNLTSLVSPTGTTHTYRYDDRGNLVGQLDPLGNLTDFAYKDIYNRLGSVRDARSNSINYDYDDYGNLTAIAYPDGKAERYEYDSLGNVVKWTNRRGHPITYAYNNNGQLTQKNYPDGSHIDFAYDSRGNMVSAINSHGTTTMQYDDADRLTKITYPSGRFLEFMYDTAGRRSRMTDQDGFITNYSYDQAGRLKQLTNGNNENIVTYSYDVVGRLVRENKGNGTYNTYQYDAAGRLLHMINYAPNGSILSQFDYTYDTLGRRISMNTIDGLWTYEYDATGQLTRAIFNSTNPQIPNQELLYVYDAAGNRIRTFINSTTAEYTTNKMDQYTEVGNATYQYDEDGNIKLKIEGSQSSTYTFDEENRLVQVATPEGTWNYEYDAFGNRIATTYNGQRIEYLLDPMGLVNIVGEYDASGNLIAHYDHGLGLIGRSDPANITVYYNFDALGSTSEITNPSGAILNNYVYDPFGVSLFKSESVANPFQFVGEYGVTYETGGLEFMRTRFYKQELGRFVSEDPIGLKSHNLNLYNYGNNAPLEYTDPTGLRSDNWREFWHSVWIAIWTALKHSVHGGEIIDIYEMSPEFANTYIAIQRYRWTLYELSGIDDFPNMPGKPSPIWLGKDGTKIGEASTNVVIPRDPNRKIRPNGFGDMAFVSVDSPLQYTIDFENVPDASAPAQLIMVTDHLDQNLDMRTFRLGQIVFGDNIISVPDNKSYYQTRTNLGPEHNNIVADISAGLDVQTGTVTWTITAIDPNTGEQPENPLIGLLPPNDPNTHSGEGYVIFTIKPFSDVAAGTKIVNSAEIRFDKNELIGTNEVFNTIDNGKPISSVSSVSGTSNPNEYLVSWSGMDDANGSGTSGYDIYVSTDGGQFNPWLSGTTATSSIFDTQPGHTYAFYSIAHDNVGNIEDAPTVPDAVISISIPDQVRPQAQFMSGNFTSSPDGYMFTVAYSDNNAVNISSLDSNDIRVTGPNGFQQLATFVNVDVGINGTPRTARYIITAPGGSWDVNGNGIYNVFIEPNQVSDTSGNFVESGLLKTFAITDSSAGQLVLEDYNVISTTRVGRTIFEYVFAVTLKNNAHATYSSVKFELFNAPANMTILDSNVVFDHIGVGESAISQGTLEVRIDLSGTTDLYTIPWRVTFEPGVLLGDFTGDGKVDFDDLSMFATYWLTDEPSVDIAPSEGDGIINFLDFAVFAQQWLGSSY
jgi:RHS repeat-associated protein